MALDDTGSGGLASTGPEWHGRGTFNLNAQLRLLIEDIPLLKSWTTSMDWVTALTFPFTNTFLFNTPGKLDKILTTFQCSFWLNRTLLSQTVCRTLILRVSWDKWLKALWYLNSCCTCLVCYWPINRSVWHVHKRPSDFFLSLRMS